MSADRITDAYNVYVRWQSKREGRLKLEKNFEVEVKCEKESEMEKEEALRVSEDILSDPVTYELQVNKSLIKCSKRVIASSHLLLDMIDLTDPKDDGPIPIPPFITKQIILDLVEMVEKGDMECAHLGKTNHFMGKVFRDIFLRQASNVSVLVSLSYLLDFLIAVDFLCCDKLKASVEEKIKEKIDETNWREVLAYTKDIIGLDNTTRAALEPIIK